MARGGQEIMEVFKELGHIKACFDIYGNNPVEKNVLIMKDKKG